MKYLSILLCSLFLVACGGGNETPVAVIKTSGPHPVAKATTVSGGGAVAIHMYQALYGMAPSNAMFSAHTAQATADPSAFARNLASNFASTSSTALAKLVLDNLNVTAATVTALNAQGQSEYAILLDALGQMFTFYGTDARGQIILNATNLLADLESDPTYGVTATSYNNQASANWTYSSSSTNSVPATISTSPLTVVFDYTYDANGFFTPERRVLMEKAATVITSRLKGTRWARVDPVATGGHYELAFVNPSTLATSWNVDVVIPENQITIYLGASNFKTAPFARMQGSEGDGASQLLSMRNISGGLSNVLANVNQYRPINSSITFDLQGIQGFSGTITRQWHFDSDGNLATDDRLQTDPHYGDYTDFYTTAIHELGHVFGIYYPAAASWMLESDPNFLIAYSSKVQADGVGGYVFTGTYAKQFYFNHVGQNIPLDASTRCHMANGVRSQTADGWTSLTYESTTPFRHLFSELEFGVLKDIGYIVSPN
jgi:hypothetical protein